jgi:hypothetical protein
MFMHGDIFHLIGNMWFLLIFGRNVECAMNHGRFLAFYTACGLAASIAHVASDPHSILPCLGASGAISGVMGAYISIHPLNTIKVWFGFWIGVIELPAIAVIGVWFVLNYLSAFISLDNEYRDGVAYWAHIGGFLAGFAIIRVVVFYLQWRKSKGDLEEEEPLAPVQKDVLGDALPPKVVGSVSAPAPAPVEVTSVQVPEGPDPFAAFLTTQSVRKLQVQKPRESTDHR